MAGAQVASRVLYPRLGPRRHIIIGLTGTAASIGLLALMGPQTNLWWARPSCSRWGCPWRTCSSRSRPRRSPPSPGLHRAGVDHVQRGAPARRRVGVAVLTTVMVAVGPVHLVAGRPVANLTAYLPPSWSPPRLRVRRGCALTIRDADAAPPFPAAGSLTSETGPRAQGGLTRLSGRPGRAVSDTAATREPGPPVPRPGHLTPAPFPERAPRRGARRGDSQASPVPRAGGSGIRSWGISDRLLTMGFRSAFLRVSVKGQIRGSASARLGQVQGGSRRMRPPRFLPTGHGGGAHVRSRFRSARYLFDRCGHIAGENQRNGLRRAQRRRPPAGRR